MTGITHEQARSTINALVDGFIKDEEQRTLDEHLASCEECRAYAAELKLLGSRLQQSFHRQWDNVQGPSENLVQIVNSRRGGIILTNRIKVGFRTLAGITALVVMGILISFVVRQLRNASVAENPTPTSISPSKQSNRLIAYVSTQDGNSEIYTMNTDGSGSRDITNNRTYDGNPVWSPDGSKIAFESDRNGNLDIFSMNPDGSGITQLTQGPGNNILSASPRAQDPGAKVKDVWSPDGSHILFSNDNSGKWTLYVMNADGGSETQLVQASDLPAGGNLWSPDGQQVAYTAVNASGSGRIIVINIDGSNRREIASADPASGDNGWQSVRLIAWSQDERSIYYEYSTQNGTWYILKVDVNGANTAQEITSGYALVQGLYVNGWLEGDSGLSYITEAVGALHGSRLQNTQNGKSIFWDSLVICGYLLPNSSQNSYSGALPISNWAVSKTGSQLVLGVTCSDKGFTEIYSLDSTTSASNKIARIPTDWSEINITWSADDQMVLFQGTDKSGKTDLYILTAEDLNNKSPIMPTLIRSGESSQALLQPVPFNGLTAKSPATAAPALQTIPPSQPLWTGTSNGDLIAFVSNATGNPDIYLAKSDGSNITNLTHRPADDFGPVWSPDGNWIAFASGFNGNYSLHLMRPDGSNEKKIGDNWWNFSWSPDGNKIAYLVSQPDNPSDAYSPAKISLKIIDLDGNILQDTYLGVYNQADQLRWSQDGNSLSYVATQMSTDNTGLTRATESDIYQISLGGRQAALLVKSDQQIDAWIGTAGNLTYLARDILTWNLFHNNRQSNTKLATWDPVSNQCGSSAPFNWDNVSSYMSRRWSPDGKRLFLEITCPDDNTTWFYLGSTSGSFIKLLNYPVLSNSFGQDSVSWSPDGRTIIFSSDLDSVGNLDIYVLNVEAALKDPSARPVRITTTGFYESSPDWQPQP